MVSPVATPAHRALGCFIAQGHQTTVRAHGLAEVLVGDPLMALVLVGVYKGH